MPMLDRWNFFLAALAETDQPRAVFAALETITTESVGTILFTTMTHDTEAMRSLPHRGWGGIAARPGGSA